MLRQARLLRALHGSAVPVPEVLWEDAGDPPDEPPLFVMAFIEGASLEPLFDRHGDDPEAVVGERMRDAAGTLGTLHALAPTSLGLAGEPVVGPGAEVDRWCQLLETVDPALAPGWSEWPRSSVGMNPGPMPAAVVHGDFRLGNLLAIGATVTAVIDWEIWSVGDPRIDVGWFLANADPATYQRPTRYVDAVPVTRRVARRLHGSPRSRTWPTWPGSRRWRASSRRRRGR